MSLLHPLSHSAHRFRYQPNTVKSSDCCLDRYDHQENLDLQLIEKYQNARGGGGTFIPLVASKATSAGILNPPLYFKFLMPLPPNIAGTARMNVKITACRRCSGKLPSIPENIPTMVDPERALSLDELSGDNTLPAIIWEHAESKMPDHRNIINRIYSAILFLFARSMTINTIPIRISMIANGLVIVKIF